MYFRRRLMQCLGANGLSLGNMEASTRKTEKRFLF